MSPRSKRALKRGRTRKLAPKPAPVITAAPPTVVEEAPTTADCISYVLICRDKLVNAVQDLHMRVMQEVEPIAGLRRLGGLNRE